MWWTVFMQNAQAQNPLHAELKFHAKQRASEPTHAALLPREYFSIISMQCLHKIVPLPCTVFFPILNFFAKLLRRGFHWGRIIYRGHLSSTILTPYSERRHHLLVVFRLSADAVWCKDYTVQCDLLVGGISFMRIFVVDCVARQTGLYACSVSFYDYSSYLFLF